MKTRPGLAVQAGTVPLAVRVAVEAERRGLPSFHSSEFYDRSAVVTLAAVAAATSRIRIGSAIAWALGRTPVATATEFRSLAELAPGRVTLGLGTGNPQVISDWHGLDEARPAARLAELVPLVRRIWEVGTEPVDHEGAFYRCRIPVDPTLQPWPRPTDPAGTERPPILLAGGRGPMLRAAGAVADGLMGLPLCSAAFTAEVVRPALAAAAEKAGRERPVPITGMTICAVSEDPARARALAATQLAVFAARASAAPLIAFHGFGSEVAAIREALGRRDMPGVAAAVSDRMLDTLAVHGTPAEARERFAAVFDGVYDESLLFTAGKGMPEGGFEDSLLGACEAFGD
ncbi:LLM class flavin-dependent oxidoreductase [Kitasatospora phosalacinea]|uniref:LLM class flavin-dependent oxidoreductase n=1 Tax=Kitasatospora phosalacinea TaxID=2065 RepID=UPI0025529E1F|nr:LLM class flavin-dependent oxidoreductase [Kitasatospora phosalacinea]